MQLDLDKNLVIFDETPEVIEAHQVLDYEIKRNPNNTCARQLKRELPSEVTANLSGPEGRLDPPFALSNTALQGLVRVVEELRDKPAIVPFGKRTKAINAARYLGGRLPLVEDEVDQELSGAAYAVYAEA